MKNFHFLVSARKYVMQAVAATVAAAAARDGKKARNESGFFFASFQVVV